MIILLVENTSAQFLDQFNSERLDYDRKGINGWTFFTGDGNAIMDFQQHNGYASIMVDATKDSCGIWWALIKHCVSANMDLHLLNKPNYELRVEGKIRVSDAPKRVNLHLNTQRTTDFHSHLMEFDIPDTTNWHTISMTTKNFNAVPGDTVFGQLALMDWGLEKYRVDIDYFKVDIVNVNAIGPDQGCQVPYHPSIPDLQSFAQHTPVSQDAIVDIEYPDMNFNNWYAKNENVELLSVGGTQLIIMRWDLKEFIGKKVNGSGLLELTTYSLQRSPDYKKDFGMVRISEIFGGNQNWDQTEVTYNNFCQRVKMNRVINSQMIIDVDVNENRNGKNLITISKPVLQRMIDGNTFGLALRPLGAINASFYAMEYQKGKYCAKLHFNLESNPSDKNINN
ncbi:MAG: hypothetical protein NTX65_02835 [Ignavibacteriales bacterium]|nr:hypothetical protein [Ignavibacteriales bacterium]